MHVMFRYISKEFGAVVCGVLSTTVVASHLFMLFVSLGEHLYFKNCKDVMLSGFAAVWFCCNLRSSFTLALSSAFKRDDFAKHRFVARQSFGAILESFWQRLNCSDGQTKR